MTNRMKMKHLINSSDIINNKKNVPTKRQGGKNKFNNAIWLINNKVNWKLKRTLIRPNKI